MPINGERLWDDLMALAAITDPDRPYTRRSFSARFDEGRRFLGQRFAAAGLAVHTDAAGNLVGRREGVEAGLGAIVVGSHSDTVPSGGRFDGVSGVTVALEIARALAEEGVTLRHPLEVVDFLAEEPSEFGLSCIGSRGWAGVLTPAMLDATGPGGETLAAALRRVGGDPGQLAPRAAGSIAAMFELHIEQGRVLEESRTDLAVVTSILGVRRLEIAIGGSADHAGTTPLPLRADALLPAAELVLAVRRLADGRAAAGDGFVATVGMLDIASQAANVVPGAVRLVVDIRSPTLEVADGFCADLRAEAERLTRESGTRLATFRQISDNGPMPCAAALQAHLRDGAAALGYSTRPLASGAGHDAAFVGRLAPVAMLFVPSRAGKSHCPEEWTDPAQLTAGAATLLEAVRRFDG